MRELTDNEAVLFNDRWLTEKDGDIRWVEATVAELLAQDVRCVCTDNVFEALSSSWADRNVVTAITPTMLTPEEGLHEYVNDYLYLEALDTETEDDGEAIEGYLQDVESWVRYDGLAEINGKNYFVFEDE
jgi:hypothetical protein